MNSTAFSVSLFFFSICIALSFDHYRTRYFLPCAFFQFTFVYSFSFPTFFLCQSVFHYIFNSFSLLFTSFSLFLLYSSTLKLSDLLSKLILEVTKKLVMFLWLLLLCYCSRQKFITKKCSLSKILFFRTFCRIWKKFARFFEEKLILPRDFLVQKTWER